MAPTEFYVFLAAGAILALPVWHELMLYLERRELDRRCGFGDEA